MNKETNNYASIAAPYGVRMMAPVTKCPKCGCRVIDGVHIANWHCDSVPVPAAPASPFAPFADVSEPCGLCGGKRVYIRGRHPGEDNRVVCPTCLAETLDDIHEKSSNGIGHAVAAAMNKESK